MGSLGAETQWLTSFLFVHSWALRRGEQGRGGFGDGGGGDEKLSISFHTSASSHSDSTLAALCVCAGACVHGMRAGHALSNL